MAVRNIGYSRAMLIHRKIKVFGRVQGVSFRDAASKEAERLGVSGFARNEPDGTVYIEAEGEDGSLEEFILWCWHGPPASGVERVEVSADKPAGFRSFVAE